MGQFISSFNRIFFDQELCAFYELFLLGSAGYVFFLGLGIKPLFEKRPQLQIITAIAIILIIWQGRLDYQNNRSPLAQARNKLNQLEGYYNSHDRTKLLEELETLTLEAQPWDSEAKYDDRHEYD